MIVTSRDEGTTMSPATWEYNACRLTTALEKVVENHGGTVAKGRSVMIYNRTLKAAAAETEAKIQEMENAIKESDNVEKNARRAGVLSKWKSELDEYKAIGNEPVEVTQHGYIRFMYDGFVYYYQTDENPFFEFYYSKTPVSDSGEYSKDACMEEDKKEWMHDYYFSFECSDVEIVEGANMIFNMLIGAKPSTIRVDSRRVRVPNSYNNRYHYENVYNKERKGNVNNWEVE